MFGQQVFFVDVKDKMESWRISRRFNQFASLNEWLEQVEPVVASSLPSFPSRITLLQSDDKTVRERIKSLDGWLKAFVAMTPLLAKEEVKNWLGMVSKPYLMYRTRSLCGRCVLLERKPLDFIPADVYAHHHQVFLSLKCDHHGISKTLYCSDLFFFERMNSFTLSSNPWSVTKVPDMEDLAKRLSYKNQEATLPLVMELVVVQHDHKTLLGVDKLKGELDRLKSLHPKGRKFVLKVLPKACTDMENLNKTLLAVQQMAQNLPVLVESTLERLMMLCEFGDSVFLKGNVYPSVKYFIVRGEEQVCVKDMKRFFLHVAQFKGIQVVLNLVFDYPMPNVGLVLRSIVDVSLAGFLRVVLLSPERSPMRLLNMLKGGAEGEKKSEKKQKQKKPAEEEEDNPFLSVVRGSSSVKEEVKVVEEERPSTDPVKVIRNIEAEWNLLSEQDFFPASVLVLMEPILRLLGYGTYIVRPHSFCGFFSCLAVINGESVPLTRVLDFSRLFAGLVPLLPQLSLANEEAISWNVARKLRSLIQESFIKNADGSVPNAVSLLLEGQKTMDAQVFFDKLTFVIVHNNMDLAAVDLIRRCSCATVTSTPLTENKIAAQCTGCI